MFPSPTGYAQHAVSSAWTRSRCLRIRCQDTAFEALRLPDRLLLFLTTGCHASTRFHRLHGRWFNLSATTFDALHYGAMAVYKIGIMLFNLVPLLVLYLLGSGG